MDELLKSKRVRIAVVGVILWGGARLGLDLDPAAVDRVLDLAMVLIATFGLTGMGKERVAEAAKTGGTITSLEVTTTTMPPPIAPGGSGLPGLPGGLMTRTTGSPSSAPGGEDLPAASRLLRDQARRGRGEPPSGGAL